MTRKARDKIAAGLHEAIAVAHANSLIKRLTAENAKLKAEAREAFEARLGPRYTHLFPPCPL